MPNHFSVPQGLFQEEGAVGYMLSTCKFFRLILVTFFHCMEETCRNWCFLKYKSKPLVLQSCSWISSFCQSILPKLWNNNPFPANLLSPFQEARLWLLVLSHPSCDLILNQMFHGNALLTGNVEIHPSGYQSRVQHPDLQQQECNLFSSNNI